MYRVLQHPAKICTMIRHAKEVLFGQSLIDPLQFHRGFIDKGPADDIIPALPGTKKSGNITSHKLTNDVSCLRIRGSITCSVII